jgi:hypothetical protein
MEKKSMVGNRPRVGLPASARKFEVPIPKIEISRVYLF